MKTHGILGKAEVDSSILSGGTIISLYKTSTLTPFRGLGSLVRMARSGVNKSRTGSFWWEIPGKYVRQAFPLNAESPAAR
jgi:hypothetical protein